MKHHVCTQHKKQTMYMYPYKLTKPSLLWFPPSSRVPPKLVNKPPSVHPLQDFPFVVISAGGEGRATGCQTKFNARPFEGNTDHKHLTGCHINTPQVWQRVRKRKVDMNSSHSRGIASLQHEKSALSVSFSAFWKTCIYVICCQSETLIYKLQAAAARPLVSMSWQQTRD